jgi:hypothetical protein
MSIERHSNENNNDNDLPGKQSQLDFYSCSNLFTNCNSIIASKIPVN